MLSKTQKQKIKQNLSWKNLALFFLWIAIFSGVNFYFNDLSTLWLGFLHYGNNIRIPYIFFGLSNALLIWLSINLLIDKMKELRSLNPWAGLFSMVWTFVALLTWACPGCIAWIFPVFVGMFGSNISMYSLPYHWVELQVLSFAFLLIWIYFLSKDMTCKIQPKTKIMHKKKLISIILLALVGTFNAAYLTYYAYLSKTTAKVWGGWGVGSFACDYNDTFSCSSVFNESFAWIFWIPFSAIALVVYPVLVIVALLGLLGKMKNHFTVLLIMSVWGLMFNGYVIYNEYVVWVYCALCLACTWIIIAIGVLSKIAMCKNKKDAK